MRTRHFIFISVFCAAFLASFGAHAAPEAMCRQYAETAVRQYEEAVVLGVPNIGPPAWSSDYNAHFNWCLTAEEAWLTSELQKREEALAPYRQNQAQAPSPPPPHPPGGESSTEPETIIGEILEIDDECARYAKQAVYHQELNQQKSCGFKGPRWKADQAYHENWCRRQSSIDIAMTEHKARVNMLVSCQQPAAAGDPRTLEPLMVPGLMLALWHGDMLKSDSVCKSGRPYDTDRQLSVLARGEWSRLRQKLKDGEAQGFSAKCAAEYAEKTESWRSFNWIAIEDLPTDIDISKLPPGLVLAFQEQKSWLKVEDTAFGFTPSPPASTMQDGPLPGTKSFYARDVHQRSQIGEIGWVWYETDRRPASQVDWALVDRLPRFTVVGLKYNADSSNDWRGNQWWKRLQWRGPDGKMKLYDPSCRDCAPPPGFVRVEAGDLGAPAGQGFVWFMKVIGPDISNAAGGQ